MKNIGPIFKKIAVFLLVGIIVVAFIVTPLPGTYL